jgi:hypothetical protein
VCRDFSPDVNVTIRDTFRSYFFGQLGPILDPRTISLRSSCNLFHLS